MSAPAISFLKISAPAAVAGSSVRLFLLVLRYRNDPLFSGCGMSPGNGGCARISSPAPGGSILMTSAPMSANILPHIGPETICANSITIRSSRALPVTRAPPEQGRRDYNPKFAAARNPTYRSVCVLPYDGSILRIAFWPASTFHSEVLVMAEFDLVLKNGMVVDGTRAPRFRSDIGIKNGRIAKIGRISSHEGAKVVDADGQIVAPGFIDLHTHYDAQIFWDPYLTISGYHGVTSVVLGNCGFGFARCRPRCRSTGRPIRNSWTSSTASRRASICCPTFR